MTPSFDRRALVRAIPAAFLAAASPLAFAQSWPNRPLHMIVPFPPGGSTDLLGRAIGEEIARSLQQAVVIENVPGAGGSIGAERAARAAPDGYTLLMGHIGTLAVNPSLYPKLAYDPLRSFTPVAWVARVPNVLVVNPAVPASSLGELIAYAKTHPGQLSYASGGNGSAAHMAMEYLKMATQASLLHIPYRGTAPAVMDVLSGQVQATFTGVPALLPHIRAGKLRALAVSSPKRLAVLPDVPTVAESGVPGTKDFEADQWYGLVAPAGTPADIVAQLNRLVNASLASNAVRERLASEGAEPTPTTPQAFGELIAREIPRWARVIKAAHITTG
ncbi:MAG TPA: tripartite tricarboxylate transporter substrate binding protein [Ramlibacter sp.]